jgi:membrane protein implicated in regulation of membrane protease activity
MAEMRLELERHLADAAADGRTAETVVGPDLATFAEAWAAESRRPGTRPRRWDEVTGRRVEVRKRSQRTLWAYAAGSVLLVAGVVAGSVLAGGGDGVDNDTWRWVWTFMAVGLSVGEIFTAGFFLLPFGIGAAAAAVLAWLGVAALAQWLVFFGVSIISLVYLRRFIRYQDEHDQARVGANRWIDARGVVLEDIEPDHSRGLVRVEGEQWRATTDGPDIPAGAKVVVREMRGTKLVVTPIEES